MHKRSSFLGAAGLCGTEREVNEVLEEPEYYVEAIRSSDLMEDIGTRDGDQTEGSYENQ